MTSNFNEVTDLEKNKILSIKNKKIEIWDLMSEKEKQNFYQWLIELKTDYNSLSDEGQLEFLIYYSEHEGRYSFLDILTFSKSILNIFKSNTKTKFE